MLVVLGKQFDICETAFQRNVTSTNPCVSAVQGRWWAEGGFDSSQDDLQDVSSNNSHAEWMSQAPVFVLLVAPSHRTGSSYLGERE